MSYTEVQRFTNFETSYTELTELQSAVETKLNEVVSHVLTLHEAYKADDFKFEGDDDQFESLLDELYDIEDEAEVKKLALEALSSLISYNWTGKVYNLNISQDNDCGLNHFWLLVDKLSSFINKSYAVANEVVVDSRDGCSSYLTFITGEGKQFSLAEVADKFFN